jgi:hypothetical protein
MHKLDKKSGRQLSNLENLWNYIDFVVWQFVVASAAYHDLTLLVIENPPESIATLPPFGPIEGHKWFFKISSQCESLRRTGLHFTSFGKIQRRHDMNGRFQMQEGKNWILPKQMNANRFFWDSHWLEIWSNHLFPSMGPNGEIVAMDSVFNCLHLRSPVMSYRLSSSDSLTKIN